MGSEVLFSKGMFVAITDITTCGVFWWMESNHIDCCGKFKETCDVIGLQAVILLNIETALFLVLFIWYNIKTFQF